jgi:heme oxygenase
MSTLRELTAYSHARAENTHFMRLFMAKALNEEEYMEYITQLSVIYTALEFAAEKVGILQELKGIERAAKVRADVAELNKKLGKQSILHWETVMYYNEIARMTDKEEILAHFYVRYAGDMYGGQMLKPLAFGSGTMYDFGDNLPVLRQKMRELATPNLADDANMAFSKTIDILDSITKSNQF